MAAKTPPSRNADRGSAGATGGDRGLGDGGRCDRLGQWGGGGHLWLLVLPLVGTVLRVAVVPSSGRASSLRAWSTHDIGTYTERYTDLGVVRRPAHAARQTHRCGTEVSSSAPVTTTIEVPWEAGRSIIAMLRQMALPRLQQRSAAPSEWQHGLPAVGPDGGPQDGALMTIYRRPHR
jgi:hypothetical protein